MLTEVMSRGYNGSSSMSLSIEIVIFAILSVWLVALTILFLRLFFYYNRLTKNGNKQSIITILDKVLLSEERNREELQKIQEQLQGLKFESGYTIQKVGLLRFNPFKDTGGDQSFILALLDAHDNGVILSSLHTRTGTRWYAKGVSNGRGLEHNLSAEEVKAIEQAGKNILKEKNEK